MNRKLLIPFEDTCNFQYGEPYWYAPKGERCCACEGFDYSKYGIRGYHLRAGHGTKESRGVHQNCSQHEPHRLTLVQVQTELRVPINVIRLEGDTVGSKIGGAMLLKQFDEQVAWTDSKIVRFISVFSPSSELQTERRYINFGLRGILAENFIKEDVEILEVGVFESTIKLFWWHDGKEGQGNRFRSLVDLEFPFVEDEWYQLTMRLIPLPAEHTWNTVVSVRSLTEAGKHLAYEIPQDKLLNQGVRIDSMAVGDEHQNMTDGGVWQIAKLEPMAIW